MNTMFFPADYKEALQSKIKNTTIRVNEEMGKYEVGETYRAVSYEGEDFGVLVLIKEVQRVDLDQLAGLRVPDSEIARVRKEGGEDLVELVRFEVID